MENGYKKLYADLFNGITDTIEKLKELQIQAEENYLKMTDGEKDGELKIVKPDKAK